VSAGRPPCCSPELARYIWQLRNSGLSQAQIQSVLNSQGIPTPMGRPHWWKSSVDRVLKTKYMRELEESGGTAA
jgi:hypothetical protein